MHRKINGNDMKYILKERIPFIMTYFSIEFITIKIEQN